MCAVVDAHDEADFVVALVGIGWGGLLLHDVAVLLRLSLLA